jgi:hypothetical protein
LISACFACEPSRATLIIALMFSEGVSDGIAQPAFRMNPGVSAKTCSS